MEPTTPPFHYEMPFGNPSQPLGGDGLPSPPNYQPPPHRTFRPGLIVLVRF